MGERCLPGRESPENSCFGALPLRSFLITAWFRRLALMAGATGIW